MGMKVKKRDIVYLTIDKKDLQRGISLMRKCLRGKDCGVYVNFGCMRMMLVLNMLLSWRGACAKFWEEFMRNADVDKYGLFKVDSPYFVFYGRNNAFSTSASLDGFYYWYDNVYFMIYELLDHCLGSVFFTNVEICDVSELGCGRMLVGLRGKQDNDNQL